MMDWENLVADIGPRLLRYFSLTFGPALADDLVQETLIRLLQKVREGKFDPRKGNARMYAFGIAHFVRVEARRRGPVEEPIELASGAPGPDEMIGAEQTRRRLRAAIATLSEAQQQVLALYLDEELSLEQIGAILDMPAATVRSHLHRSKELLKHKLSGGGNLERA